MQITTSKYCISQSYLNAMMNYLVKNGLYVEVVNGLLTNFWIEIGFGCNLDTFTGFLTKIFTRTKCVRPSMSEHVRACPPGQPKFGHAFRNALGHIFSYQKMSKSIRTASKTNFRLENRKKKFVPLPPLAVCQTTTIQLDTLMYKIKEKGSPTNILEAIRDFHATILSQLQCLRIPDFGAQSIKARSHHT